MQAISKANHEKFCKLIQDLRASQLLKGNDLIELESELETIFYSYLHSLADIKMLIIEYDNKQKAIRNTIKRLLRTSPSRQVKTFSL
ncbi:MAG: hypothetical protein H7Y01_00225 [Ferruginibacter sp.]|nr:hypothetical protein [Chitinophagaceae bacterium]